MKNLFCTLLMLLVVSFCFAQKGKPNKAKKYLDDGEIVEAKAEIDMAITIEKNLDKTNTWFIMGEIYEAIALSDKPIDDNAVSKALKAYDKVKEMEKPNSTQYNLADLRLEQFWGNFINQGGELYGQGNYLKAYENFENALLLRPQDSLTLFYAGIAAQQAEKYDKAVENYNKLIETNNATEDVFTNLIFLERQVNEDLEKALKVVRIAKKQYPDNDVYSKEEISLLITLEKIEEAQATLKEAIKKEPDNAILYLNLAVLYDNIGLAKQSEEKYDEADEFYKKAAKNYRKVIELEPENFIGNFNMGAIYTNMAKRYYDEVRDMSYNEFKVKGEEVAAKGNDILIQGLPYMERAVELEPEDMDALEALKQMYNQLKESDKAMEIQDRIDSLGG